MLSEASEIQFQKERLRNRIVVVRPDFLKTERAIQLDGMAHCAWNRIEPHSRVARLASLVDQIGCQFQSELVSAKFGPHVQSLHFANARLELLHGDAGGRLCIHPTKNQTSIRTGIRPG